MVRKPYWLTWLPKLLMECPHGLVVVRKYLYWSVVDLGEGLDLDVVAPDAVLALASHVLFDVPADYELAEEVLLGFDVVQAGLTNHPVLAAISTIHLVRYRPE
eukprot:CAMPEP_0202964402 /NCGR_PEP_ID=MMETSP1396-20130829/8475_1 /ASSEMBLY_ACC=CAM_ASM_000872 /TAXON_ID= /ORGANISM="Pseudokeronopsis sp., Strain Brazil" /LENGTH=102 /DNA_ID=CAMNT_0049686471 /DNA_START=460 /DNA_END=768 /DNA_ORIENTATION=+